MKSPCHFFVLAAGIVLFSTLSITAQDVTSGTGKKDLPVPGKGNIPSPEQSFGFTPGADKMLFTYEEMFSYFTQLSKASPMVKVVEIGKSPMGRKMFMALVSSEKNIKELEQLRTINRELALNADLSDTKQAEYIKNGKVFFLATLSMHSPEVAPSQAAPLTAWKLITSGDPAIRKYLDDVVYMIVPQNPDGMDMVVENYRKYKGTKYEGASMPGIYHKYIGHDNNRDFVSLTQSDTRAIARIYDLDWFPQVMIDKHQMSLNGIRYFVPPVCDPIAENIDAGLWSWTGVIGTNMLKDLTGAGLAGVGQKTLFDDYWPGSTETSLWKGVISMLTEAASVTFATPVYIEPNELAVGKGLGEYEKSISFPMPWKGGWWRLGDIVRLETESTLSLLKTCSMFREEILKFRNDLCRKEVQKGKSEPPYYFVIPSSQADQSEFYNLVNLLTDQGVKEFVLGEDFTIAGKYLKKGDIVLPMAQSFRPFIKEVMEKQVYPVRHTAAGGEILRPYDITSWSLPLHRNLICHEINTRDTEFEKKLKPLGGKMGPSVQRAGTPLLFPVTSNGSYKAAFAALKSGAKVERVTSKLILNDRNLTGSFLISGGSDTLASFLVKESRTDPVKTGGNEKYSLSAVKMPKVALVETYFHDMDAGWTRFVLDSYDIPFTVLHPGEIEKAGLNGKFDVIIFPGAGKQILMTGKPGTAAKPAMSNYPPEFQKGIGAKGLEKLMLFVNDGGTIVAMGESSDLFTGMQSFTRDSIKEEFMLPYSNEAEAAAATGLFVPGSLVKTEFIDHPLTYGVTSGTGVFYGGDVLFSTRTPGFDMDRRVIARFPEKDMLMSGYAEKEDKLSKKPAMLWLRKGKGQLILYSFYPVFRASTQATFKLLFNALLLTPEEATAFAAK